MTTRVVILAAGTGSPLDAPEGVGLRHHASGGQTLGDPPLSHPPLSHPAFLDRGNLPSAGEQPSALAVLRDGRTILQHQLDAVRQVFGSDVQISIVVGYRLESVVEAAPNARFVYNESYDQTGTSKSLLRALKASKRGGVLWINGNVVFDAEILRRGHDLMLREQSFVATSSAGTAQGAAPLTASARRAAGFALTPEGFIGRIGSNPPQRAGDAIGLGYVSAGDKKALMRGLAAASNRDATERGIELAIEHDSMLVEPLDVSGLHAVDVDHPGDLDRANAFV